MRNVTASASTLLLVLAACGTGAVITTGMDAETSTAGSGFYVSPMGNDSNAGTLNKPFATLGRAKRAMRSSSIKTTYVEAGTYHMTSGLILTVADNGETWQYYPPDGVDTADLDGGSTVDLITLNGVNNLTINGLKLSNPAGCAIHSPVARPQPQLSGILIENNDIGNNHTSCTDGFGDGFPPLVSCINCVNSSMLNNYVHDFISIGLTFGTNAAGQSIANDVISGNVILRGVTQVSDGGAIQPGNSNNGCCAAGQGIVITKNFVGDLGGPNVGGAACYYLDDSTSNAQVTLNVCRPFAKVVNAGGRTDTNASEIHNGAGNVIENNLFDLGTSGGVYAAEWFLDSASVNGMAGNLYEDNLHLFNFSGGQNAVAGGCGGVGQTSTFYCTNSNSIAPTISSNAGAQYGSGSIPNTGTFVSGGSPITVSNPSSTLGSCPGGNYVNLINNAKTAGLLPSNFPTSWGPLGSFKIPAPPADEQTSC